MMVRDHFRAHPRRRVELQATLRARDGRVSDVAIRDLGLGGACVELVESGRADAPLEREVSVTLELTTPSLWDPLLVRGKVAWVRRSAQGRAGRAGIRFEHRDAATVYALFRLLSSQAHETA